MPRETVGSTTIFNGPADHDGAPRPDGMTAGFGGTRTWSLCVGWRKDGHWVQAHMIPDRWQSTGEWIGIDLDPEQIDHLIRVLRRAKRQAYPAPPT